MDKQYNFSYEPVSVYANAVDLIRKHSSEGSLHIDLGCGYAAIARQLESYGIKYIGFDANRDSVESLGNSGVEAYELDLSKEEEVVARLKSISAGYSVVTISLLDVIEHLDYDCRLLSRIRESFSSSQKLVLILSVPNFSHADVAIKFLSGKFDYTGTGLLDKTHKIIYTESNLSEVTNKNGWKQIADNDYHLEFSEQFSLTPSILLNRDGGVGKALRQLKGVLDPNSDVYQFVRAYIPGESAGKSIDACNDLKDFSLSMVFSEAVTSDDLSDFVEKLSCMGSDARIDLVVSQKMKDVLSRSIDSDRFRVVFYDENTFEGIIQCSMTTRYWSLITDPAKVCITSLDTLVASFDGSRGSPLLELSDQQSSCGVCNQFELFLSLDTSNSWRFMIPTDCTRQFHDMGFTSAVEEWPKFVRRVALICGVVRVYSDILINQGVASLPEDRDTIISEVFNDEKMRSCIIHSNDWVEVILEEFGKNKMQQERNTLLENRVVELQGKVNEIVSSNSWVLTRPLRVFRRASSGLLGFVKALFARDKMTVTSYARAIYLKVPFLKYFWSFYLYRKTKLVQGIRDKTFSARNTHALNELSKKRFSDGACFSLGEELDEYPEIDISVVSFNSSRWVASFFESLISQNYPLSKINFKFVDNGSTDNTVALFKDIFGLHGESFSSIEVIQQGNLGFGAGHDRAIRSGNSAFCLIVNLDLEFLPDSIVNAVTAAVNDPSSTTASWEFRQVPYEHPKYYDPVTLETNWSSHACVLLKREAYARCGGYDHAIFMYGEDVELSYRLRSFGYSLKYLPIATVLHHTYEEAGEVKPLQFSGSILGNTYIRLRYGSLSDRIMAFVLYGSLFLHPSRFPGSKKMLLRNVPKLLKNTPHFLKGKGSAPAEFPFRGYDYELIRDGAFWTTKPISASSPLPLVTVITRTYQGRGVLLKQAMQSVFNQTYPNIELIVAEDGGSSQKELVDLMAGFSKSPGRVRFLANDKIGRSGTGNAAMAIATGQFFMFLDDDDLLFSDHIETLMQCLSADATVDAAYSLAFEVTTALSEEKDSYVEELFFTPPVFHQEWDYEVLRHHNFIPIQSILFKKELYQRWGGFDLTLDQLEDWNLWLRYGYGGNFKFIKKTTSLFRTPTYSNVRAERHALLHEAYEMAKAKAESSINASTSIATE
jgi:GT2 family glycosyltransferase